MDLALNNLQRLICHKTQQTNKQTANVFLRQSLIHSVVSFFNEPRLIVWGKMLWQLIHPIKCMLVLLDPAETTVHWLPLFDLPSHHVIWRLKFVSSIYGIGFSCLLASNSVCEFAIFAFFSRGIPAFWFVSIFIRTHQGAIVWPLWKRLH